VLAETLRILNFDDSVTRQRNLLRRVDPVIVDLTHLGPVCRISMDGAAAKAIRRALKPELRSAVTFVGSGDFHHVSSLLIEQFEEPISVIVFDHHPDWDTLPPKLHCGSWVTEALRRRNVKKLILLGVSSEDISSPWIQTGNLRAFEGDRVELYPYAHRPTKIFLRHVPDNRCARVTKTFLSSTIHWQELGQQNMTAFVGSVLDRLEPKQVYVSIDKDCLRVQDSLTNWEEGRFSLEEFLPLLRLIDERLEIVGLDIVGDYSPPVVKGWLKAALARIDRPRDYSARGKPESSITAVNEGTNLKILDVLTRQSVPAPEPRRATRP